jgi:hypothetical protein
VWLRSQWVQQVSRETGVEFREFRGSTELHHDLCKHLVCSMNILYSWLLCSYSFGAPFTFEYEEEGARGVLCAGPVIRYLSAWVSFIIPYWQAADTVNKAGQGFLCTYAH